MLGNAMLPHMRFFLPILASVLSFLAMYLAANIILSLYGERARWQKRALFAFLTGPVISLFPIYLLHMLGFIDTANTPVPLLYLLFRNINPLAALLCWYMGIKILDLSPQRSLRLICGVCLCMASVKNVNMFVGSACFGQTLWEYDTPADFYQQISMLLITVLLYFVMKALIKRMKPITITDGSFLHPGREVVRFIAISTAVFLAAVFLPLIVPNPTLAYMLILFIIALIIIICIQSDTQRSSKVDLENKNVHINTLNTTIENFRGIKHDFYNILHTYGGYLEIGDLDALRKYHAQLLHLTTSTGSVLDLHKEMKSNPALVTLLLNKAEYASKAGVRIGFTILSDIEDLYSESIDLCRALACLLDNAIEAAADSEKRRVDLIIKTKEPQAKLIIITNSTPHAIDVSSIVKPGVTSKEGHSGIGLPTVRKVLEKYDNCSFSISYFDHEFNAYIELRPRSTRA